MARAFKMKSFNDYIQYMPTYRHMWYEKNKKIIFDCSIKVICTEFSYKFCNCTAILCVFTDKHW